MNPWRLWELPGPNQPVFCARNIQFLRYFLQNFALKRKCTKSICAAILKSDSIAPYRAVWLLTQLLTAVMLPYITGSTTAIDTRWDKWTWARSLLNIGVVLCGKDVLRWPYWQAHISVSILLLGNTFEHTADMKCSWVGIFLHEGSSVTSLLFSSRLPISRSL